MSKITLSLSILAVSLLLSGCIQQREVRVTPAPKVMKDTNTTQTAVLPPPKKNIELKEVEDENFSSEYMYPETAKKTPKKTQTQEVSAAPNSDMSKGECISMIGQDKFDKYAQMYGGETASIKKCKMLKTL